MAVLKEYAGFISTLDICYKLLCSSDHDFSSRYVWGFPKGQLQVKTKLSLYCNYHPNDLCKFLSDLATFIHNHHATGALVCILGVQPWGWEKLQVYILPLTHRLLIVLEGLAGLLIGADLLTAFSLDVPLLHLLQHEVGPAQPSQHRMGRICWQEHWKRDTKRGKKLYHYRCITKKIPACLKITRSDRKKRGKLGES